LKKIESEKTRRGIDQTLSPERRSVRKAQRGAGEKNNCWRCWEQGTVADGFRKGELVDFRFGGKKHNARKRGGYAVQEKSCWGRDVKTAKRLKIG